MTPLDPEARERLRRSAAPGGPVDALTAGVVRRDDLAVLELQATPLPLHAVNDIELPGPPGARIARVSPTTQSSAN
jgi:hypothetical protein